MSGTVKSAIGLGSLLWFGIGDTIRCQLSADPVEEVKVGFEILKSLGLRHRGVTIISCPSCARQGFDVIKTVSALEERLAHITTSMSLSIIGCVVNGPGEALMTDIGFTGGGAGKGMVYLAGKQDHTLSNDRMVESHRRTGGERRRRKSTRPKTCRRIGHAGCRKTRDLSGEKSRVRRFGHRPEEVPLRGDWAGPDRR
jgi:1-hydroxy-2-methyl-2-(E)-butenyl 4-diphosphate synthase